MLAPDDDSRAIDALRSSLASDIVELVVLSRDEVFLQTLREAVGPARRLWNVGSADKVADLLLAGGVGILVLDAQALDGPASSFLPRIKHQFPDLVIVVAGARDAETELARLISDGTVYRFIHKPMSPPRARLFADAAVKRYEEQRRRTGAASSHRPRAPIHRRGLAVLVACAVLGAIAAALWINRLEHKPAESPAPAAAAPTSQAAAPAPGATALAPSALPEAASAARAADAEREHWLALAEKALLEERLADASAAIDAARRAGADGERLSLAMAGLARARAERKAAAVSGRAASPVGALRAQTAPEATPEATPQATSQTPDEAAPPSAPAAKQRADADAAARLLESARLIAKAQAALSSQQYEAARGWLDQSASIGYGSPDQDALRRAVDAALAREKFSSNVIDANQLALVKSVRPEYPLKARERAIEGWVEIYFTVSESGQVKDVTVHASSPSEVFDQSAMRALSQWRYKPVMEDGKPVPQRARLRIRFELTP